MSKTFLFFIFSGIFLSANYSLSQIETGKVVPKEQEEIVVKPKKEKKKKKERIPFIANETDSTYNSYLLFGTGVFFTQPINTETNTLFSHPMTLQKAEKGMVVPMAAINYKVNIIKGLYANFGVDYLRTGEKFSWKSTTSDSTFAYTNKYQLISIPIGLNYIVGKKVKFIGGFGVAPNLTFGSKQFVKTTTTAKKELDYKTPLRERMNDFNISGYVQAGVQFRLVNGFYFYVIPEMRYSFVNTLNKQATYSRKFWALGAQFGFSLAF